MDKLYELLDEYLSENNGDRTDAWIFENCRNWALCDVNTRHVMYAQYGMKSEEFRELIGLKDD